MVRRQSVRARAAGRSKARSTTGQRLRSPAFNHCTQNHETCALGRGVPVRWTIAGPLQLREGQGGWRSESGTSDGDSKAPRIEGAEAGVGKGSTTCSASAMVLLFASIPEGLERRSRMLDFTHSRGRSRTVATTRECMAFKRSWIGRTAARLADHNDSRATCGDCARSSRRVALIESRSEWRGGCLVLRQRLTPRQ